MLFISVVPIHAGDFNASFTPGNYNSLHVAVSAGGSGPNSPAKFKMTLNYEDGSTESTDEFQCPDWQGEPPEKPGYVLKDNMEWYVHGDSFFDNGYGGGNSDSAAIWGFAVPADNSKVLESVTFTVTENKALVFGFLGGAASTQKVQSEAGNCLSDASKIVDPLSNRIAQAEASIESSVNDTKTSLANDINSAKSSIASDVSSAQSTLKGEIDSAETSLANDIDSAKSSIASNLSSVESAMKSEIDSAESSLKAEVQQAKENLSQQVMKVNQQVEWLSDQVRALRNVTDSLEKIGVDQPQHPDVKSLQSIPDMLAYLVRRMDSLPFFNHEEAKKGKPDRDERDDDDDDDEGKKKGKGKMPNGRKM